MPRTGQKLGAGSTTAEQVAVGPHLRHPDPHPQYALVGETGISQAELDAAIAAEAAARDAAIDQAIEEADGIQSVTGENGVTAITSGNAVVVSLSNRQVVHPLDGAVLDVENGTLVWDIDTQTQVVDAA